MLDTKAMIAEVIPEKRTNPEREIFSYLVPEELEGQIKIGSLVEIPFGKNAIRGVIASIAKQSSDDEKIAASPSAPRNDERGYQLKKLLAVNSQFSLPEPYLHIAQWISEYYLCSLGEAVSLFLPPVLARPRKQVASNNLQVTSKKIRLSAEQEAIFNQLSAELKNINSRPAVLHGVTGSGKTEIYLKSTGECLNLDKQAIILVPEIMLTSQIIKRFEENFPGQVALMHSNLSKSERYDSYKQFANGDKRIIIGPRSALLVPSNNLGLIVIDEEQEDAYKQEKAPRYHAVVLAEKIAEETDAMLLLGSATPSIESYFKASCCYSELEKQSEESCEQGERTACGLDSSPKTQNKNEKHLFELKNRYHQMILPPTEIVDLKNEIKLGNFSPVSEKLQMELAEVLKNKKQAILFINRRGAATFVSCRDCGNIILCPNCDIPLVYHIGGGEQFLNCHHCDFRTKVPRSCPACGGYRIKYFGSGIEKIEMEIKRLYPKARIKRVDSKILENKGEYAKLHRDLVEKKIDILIGTQIVAKGLDLPEVDLVGVISADTGLHLPHFRANEKTFQIITQVSGRSGRKNNVGKTIIQTYWPESRAIKFASMHDYEGFFKEEIADRKEHDYPPFKHIIRIVSEDANKAKAKRALEEVAGNLASVISTPPSCQGVEKSSNEMSYFSEDPSSFAETTEGTRSAPLRSARDDKKNTIDFIGPAPCFLSRLYNKYRYQILIKANKWPDDRIRNIFLSNPYLIWDVDPTDLL